MQQLRYFGILALFAVVGHAGAFPANGVDSYDSPEQACAEWARSQKGTVVTRDTGDGNVGCTVKSGDDEWKQESVGKANCPMNSRPTNMRNCECEPGYAYSDNRCVDPAAANAPRRTAEEIIASTPQNRDPGGCGLSKEQQRAIRSILGQKFSDISYLRKAWDSAVAPAFTAEVASLVADPKTNKKNRDKYFAKTRDAFWDNLSKDDTARAAFADAKIKFPATGRAAQIEIDGKTQTLDVDHIIGLAENPKLMITTANLQLSPQRENRVMLEKIARNDRFYDPDAWLTEQAKKAAKSCSLRSKKRK